MDKLFAIQQFQNFEEVLKRILHNLTYNSSSKIHKTFINIELSDIKAAEDEVRKLISDCNFDMTKVEEKLSGRNWDNERIRCFINLLGIEKTKLMYAFINYHNSGYGETVTQSDWILKLVLGTSELTTVKYPLLQLILSTVDINGVQNKKMFELNKDILTKTIEMLERTLKTS